MRDILEQVVSWSDEGHVVALATVVATSSSAPRPPGTSLAVHPDGTVAGNVSGGCVDAAVVDACRTALQGAPATCLTFGYSDDEALAVGLTCGGTIRVLVRALRPEESRPLALLHEARTEGRPVALATVVEGPGLTGRTLLVDADTVVGDLGHEGLTHVVAGDARGAMAQGRAVLRHYGPTGRRDARTVEVFVEGLATRPRLVVVGALDVAAALAEAGRFVGFHVTVCDPREVFATADRLPAADEVVVEWPHRYLAGTDVDDRTAICVLTHETKFDVPAILAALRTPAAYIGVMGSRRTHEERLERLRAAGVTDGELARLRSPVGLDLGGRSAEETAISIVAEIIRDRWGGTGLPLRETRGPIHG